MAFHELLDKTGGTGRFQCLQTIFFMICTLVLNSQVLLENFTGATPDHRCWVDVLDNGTVSDNGTWSFSQEALVRVFIPLDSNLRPEKCRRFIHPQWQLHMNGTFSSISEVDTESCMDGWVYDNSSFLSTTVTEWDLVCDSQSLNSVSKFLFMTGILIGNILYGYLTDRFGRKLIFRSCLLQSAIITTCTRFSPNFLIYCLLRFLTGLTVVTITTSCIMINMEWAMLQYQTREIILINSMKSAGNIILAGMSFAIHDWHTLQLVCSVPIFVLFLCSRWLVESARWLIVNNKPEEGLKSLKKVAYRNGVKNTEDILTMEVLRAAMKEEMQRAQNKPSLGSLFHAPELRKRICLLMFMRFANLIPMFGLALHLQHLGKNVSLLHILFATVNFLGNFVSYYLLNFQGRRISHLISSCLTGILILGIPCVPEEMQRLRIALSTAGAAFSFMAFTINGAYANELLPTTTRATGLGIVGTAGGIGGAMAPLLMILRMYYALLPWIIYAAIAILGGLAVLFLPETRNQPLPESIQDLENMTKGLQQQKLHNAPIKVTRL